MCNAYSVRHARDELVAFAAELAEQLDLAYDDSGLPADLAPRYRISPRQRAPILRLGADGTLAWSMDRWGLVVQGGKAGFAPTNARSDKLVSGWPWKMISRTQRCLVPTDGFYEPEKRAGEKGTVPWHYYAMGNRQLFVMAGLWSRAPDPKTGEEVETYTVVTTDANAAIRVHDRMPAILDHDAIPAWLAPGQVPTAVLGPYPAERMTGWRVADEARSSRSPDHPGLIEPVEAPT